MSASISWKPVKNVGKGLDVGAPSAFVERMEKVFGSLPLELLRTDIPKLEVLALLYDNNDCKPYQELIDALDSYEKIEVWATY